ncbi:MAG: 3-dehydroquinate synthase [Acidobacteriales bacterium]|nr:3-dehydroquinate synthase [Terriglobales bacterium]
MTQTISVALPGRSYDVVIGPGVLASAGRRVRAVLDPSLMVVVTSSPIRKRWGRILEQSLRRSGIEFVVVPVPDGEPAKTLANLSELLRKLVHAGADRRSCVIALGGGVVGDLAGFAAATFLRGVPIVQVPTTLLAQVDAAVGGKTGVNLPEGKNLVGAFHQPVLVLADTSVLATLPEREYRAGLFEVLKCGVIRDADLFRFVERSGPALLRRERKALARVVAASVRVKADVVAADEREGDLRRVLNFGHTVGHALEAATGYKLLRHGEAVGLGMIAAAEIGVNAGVTPESVAERIIAAVHSLGPLPKIKVSPARVMRLMTADKKALRGVPSFVLATDIGEAVIKKDIDAAIVKRAIANVNAL